MQRMIRAASADAWGPVAATGTRSHGDAAATNGDGELDGVICATVVAAEAAGLPPVRGPMPELARAISRVNAGLTLELRVDPATNAEAVIAKNLYVLWITALDDTIDRDASLSSLHDSVAVLMANGARPSTPAGRLLSELLRRTRALGDDLGTLTVALFEVATAMRYAHACRTDIAIAEPSRFLRHAIATLGLEVHLAIDRLADATVLDHTSAMAVSHIYHDLSAAMRYANDLGGNERDRREGTFNILSAWELSEPGEPRTTLTDRARARAGAHMRRARERARTASVPGVSGVIATVQGIVDVFSAGDPFGDPSPLTR